MAIILGEGMRRSGEKAPATSPPAEVDARSDEHLRFLVDSVKDLAICLLDGAGTVVTWTAGAERLSGYAAHEITGTHFARLYPPEDVEAARPQKVLALTEWYGRHEEECWRVRKNGSRFWAGVTLTALRDREGTLVGFGEVTRDLTERDELLARLRTLNAELEERVQSRTAALAATLREREVLLQEVHHRVKNNLQVISSLISMQVRSLGADASREALLECRRRVQAIALIHERLYEAGDYAWVPFSEYAGGLAASIVEATGISPERVTLDLAVADVALGVDKAIPCGLILNELITNALKHAFPDGRRGRIRVELSNAGAAGLRLAVSDDGVSLPAGFDLRTSSSLGLQLVQMLARQLDATLEVETGSGTCFRLAVPEPA
jgi:PAS domain S-box-containing protein